MVLKNLFTDHPEKNIIVLLVLLCLLVIPLTSFAETTVLSVSDGKGEIRFLWGPTLDFFPDKGWQLKRLSDGTVVKRWTPDNRREAVAEVRPDYADSTEQYIKDIPNITTEEEQDMALGLISTAAGTDFEMARALGLGCIITTTPGKARYQLEMTDSQGTILTTLWQSSEIDSTKASKPVPPPTSFGGVSTEKGVALSWDATRETHAFITTFMLQRLGQDKEWQNISRHSLANALKNESQEEKKPNFIDQKAPLETKNEYRLCAIDIFGRTSPFVTTSIFNADYQALDPPSGLSATGKTALVELQWKEHQNPYTAGYFIERKIVGSELYAPITPKGLARETTTFTDKAVIGGVSYEYQIRSIDPRGNLGVPTVSVAVTPKPPALRHPQMIWLQKSTRSRYHFSGPLRKRH